MKIVFKTLLIISITTNLFSKTMKVSNVNSKLNSTTLVFTENKGQIVDQNYNPRLDVLFSGKNNNLTFHLRNDGISYQLNKIDNYKEIVDPKTALSHKKVNQQTIYRIDLKWLNINPTYQLVKGNATVGENNYYTAGCPENGALHVKNFQQVTYQNIYSGIDLMWYEKNGELKYDYICAAGSNYQQINIEIKGAVQLRISKNGELIIQTPLGNIIEKAPYVIQNGMELKSKWILKNNTICFEIENLAPNTPYIIDPAVRVWGTYYGSNDGERIQATAIDINGNIICSGYTDGATTSAIATTGAHQTTLGGVDDAFLVKFDANGVRQWGTYYGGTSADYGYGCSTDNSGNIFWSGYTQSTGSNVIATVGSHQSTLNGTGNAFLVKLNTNGVRQWGTYYGGTGNTWGYDCKTDGLGDVYLVGSTQSNSGTVISTSGAHQSMYGGGTNDGYIAKFNTSGSRIWATYYGGALEDQALYSRVNSLNEVIICGTTRSSDNIATSGTHQDVISSGVDYDAFLLKLDANGNRQWCTYYGGTGLEYGYSICFSPTSDIYLSGVTNSTVSSSISTAGAHQVSPGGGGYRDAFLVKFNNSGLRQWGTFYGGSLNEYGLSCDSDSIGNIYITGYTESSNNISSTGSYQATFGGAVKDIFLIRFNSNGIRSWGTYYGGTGNEEGLSCVVNSNGSIFVSGYSSSGTGTIIATTGTHQANFGGTEDGFLVKFDECTPPIPINTTPLSNLTICDGSNTTLFANSGLNTINWYATASSSTILGTGTSFTTPVLNTGTYSYFAEASGCVVSESRTEIIITVSPSITSSQNPILCPGQSVTVGTNTYSVSGTYTDILTAINGCDSTVTTNLLVNPAIVSPQNVNLCSGQTITVGANTYSITGTYTDVFTAFNGCDSTVTTNLTINPAIDITTTNSGNTITSNATSGSYQWINCNNGNNPIVGETNQAYTATTSGDYAVIITYNGCSDTSACVNVIVTGINENSNLTLLAIYPNPTYGIISIQGTKEIGKVDIYNALGELVYTNVINNNSDKIDISYLQNGIYFLYTGEGQKRLIVNK